MGKILKYKEIEYIVHVGPLGSFCAYVKIPAKHPWNKLVDKVSESEIGGRKYKFHNGYDDIPLNVHGGLTFSRRIGKEKWEQGFTPGAWVGWDYAHAGDFVPAFPLPSFPGQKIIHHRYEEVEADCHSAIDQLLEAGGAEYE